MILKNCTIAGLFLSLSTTTWGAARMNPPMTMEEIDQYLESDSFPRGSNASERMYAEENPLPMSQLCINGRERACFVIAQTVTPGGGTLGIERINWDNADRDAALRAMNVACGRKPNLYNGAYCEARYVVEFNKAKIHNFPDRKHPRWCFMPETQYRTIKSCWTNHGVITGSCEYSSEVSGYETINYCGYSLDVGLVYGGHLTVKPGGSIQIDPNDRIMWLRRR